MSIGCLMDSFKMRCIVSRRIIFFDPYAFITRDRSVQEGQGLTEYALLIVPIALVIIVVVALMGDSITNAYCAVTETFTEVDGEPCYETLTQIGDGPTVLRAKYRDFRDGIVLRAKTDGCTGDIVVVDYGIMDQGGDSGNYSITIITDNPLDTITVGSDNCGWTTVTID